MQNINEIKCTAHRTLTRLHHCLCLLRRPWSDVGQSPSCLELQRWTSGQKSKSSNSDFSKCQIIKEQKRSAYPYLSSLSRQCTRMGRIPDFIKSSMGGLRSLDSSFLGRKCKVLWNAKDKQADKTHYIKSCTQSRFIYSAHHQQCQITLIQIQTRLVSLCSTLYFNGPLFSRH